MSGVVDPEDREIIEKLAKLQNMYSQVSVLPPLSKLCPYFANELRIQC